MKTSGGKGRGGVGMKGGRAGEGWARKKRKEKSRYGKDVEEGTTKGKIGW